MKRHAGGQSSETRREKRAKARRKDRERRIARRHNILTRNTSLAERARRRGEDTVETSRRSPLFGGGKPWTVPEELAALWRNAGGGK
jgi:hypothetical protein